MNLKTYFKIGLITLGLFTFSSQNGLANEKNELCKTTKKIKSPKYVFYIIGDGTSTPQINMAEAALHEKGFRFSNFYDFQTPINANKKIGLGRLYLRQFPIVGMINTYAKNRYITDSAAAGTALASGNKTSVGTIGMDDTHTKKFESVAAKAKKKGMKVGIVTSVSIDHATPAAFYAHTASRNNYEEIGNQLLKTNFDYFAGGSVKWGNRKTLKNVKEYAAAAEKEGYSYIDTRNDFEALNRHSGKVIATLNMLGEGHNLSDGSSLPYTIDYDKLEKENQLTLADFTKKGIELLENPKGFFMMIESGKIDWACHANDAVSVAYEVVLLDQVVKVALDFYKKHPDETLIVVTGDHETGGLTLGYAGTHYESAFHKLSYQKMSATVFAQKIGKWKKSPSFTFEKAMEELGKAFGLGSKIKLSAYEKQLLQTAYNKTMGKATDLSKQESELRYGYYDPLTVTATHLLANKSGVAWTTYSHTGLPVPVFVIGAGQEVFQGYYDNTEIAKRILNVTKWQ